MKKITRSCVIAMTVICLAATSLATPFSAYAEEGALMDGVAAARLLLDNRQEQFVRREPTAESTQDFPEKYDLRDLGVVTPVKSQGLWGTCWGFSAIAAAETSILSEMGKTYEETGLDLSEHHLAYFARTHLNDGSAQDGEGIHMLDDTDPLSIGGIMFTATSMFSTGMGVVEEELIPYRGKNSKTYGAYGVNLAYDTDDDWTIPEDYEFIQSYELEHSEILASPAIYDPTVNMDELSTVEERNEAYLGYDQRATDRMKQALMEGYGISIAYAADTYSPEQLGREEEAEYINVADNKWTHYTYDGGAQTHAVTIVGWDDTIKATDFLNHSQDEYGDGLPHQPEGDGAWIVKNSWGADTESFPNRGTWGIENEKGRSTGYFYLSYYDRSIMSPEIFDFKVTGDEMQSYIIDQHDYLQSTGTRGWIDTDEIRTANVFTAEYDEILRGLSCETSMQDTSVTYEVYLLGADTLVPTEGELVLVTEAQYELPGYHRLDLEDSQMLEIPKGQRYAVVVKQETEYDGAGCYTVSATVGNSEEAVDAYNRKQKVNHEDSYISYYAKGVVNPGESLVYFAETDSWADFAEIIPELAEEEAFADNTFDNFPIKAYLDLKNKDDLHGEERTPLDYAPPAGTFDFSVLAKYAGILLLGLFLLISYIVLIVKNVRRKKLIKKQKEALATLEERLTQLTEAQEEKR